MTTAILMLVSIGLDLKMISDMFYPFIKQKQNLEDSHTMDYLASAQHLPSFYQSPSEQVRATKKYFAQLLTYFFLPTRAASSRWRTRCRRPSRRETSCSSCASTAGATWRSGGQTWDTYGGPAGTPSKSPQSAAWWHKTMRQSSIPIVTAGRAS